MGLEGSGDGAAIALSWDSHDPNMTCQRHENQSTTMAGLWRFMKSHAKPMSSLLQAQNFMAVPRQALGGNERRRHAHDS